MLKRTLIVIVWFMGVVFVPYFLGKFDPINIYSIQPFFHFRTPPYYITGMVYLFFASIFSLIALAVKDIFKMLTNYIKNGN